MKMKGTVKQIVSKYCKETNQEDRIDELTERMFPLYVRFPKNLASLNRLLKTVDGLALDGETRESLVGAEASEIQSAFSALFKDLFKHEGAEKTVTFAMGEIHHGRGTGVNSIYDKTIVQALEDADFSLPSFLVNAHPEEKRFVSSVLF